MKRLLILAAIAALSATPALAQFRPPPVGMDKFKLITAKNGETWWRREVSEPGNRWVHYAKPVDGSWFDPPLAVISRAEYVAASESGLVDPEPGSLVGGAVTQNFGLTLDHRPESPGFSTNDGTGSLVLDAVRQDPHVHTADCDDGRCPSPDTPDSPDEDDPELLRRHAAIDWPLYAGIGLVAVGIAVVLGFSAIGIVLVVAALFARRDG